MLSASQRYAWHTVSEQEIGSLFARLGANREMCDSGPGSVEELSAREKRQGLLLLVRKCSPDYVKEGLEYIDKLIDKVRDFRMRLETITGKARK